LVLVLAFFAWLPSLGADFVWDDIPLVVHNQLTSSLANLPAMFRVDLWASTGMPEHDSGFYRPLLLLDFWLDRAVGGMSPVLHHAHSLAWHLLACWLVWRLLVRVVGPTGAAAGLPFFALHPAQVEAVSWVSARNDPMTAALLVGGLLLLDRDVPRVGDVVVGGLLVLAALLTKESALLAPLLLATVALARTGRPGSLRGHAAVLAAVVVYLGLRVQAGVPPPVRADLAHLQAAVPQSLAFYARDLLWPVDLAPGLHLAWPPAVPWPMLGLLAVAAGALLALGQRRALGGLVFAALTLAPALPAVAHQGLVADRYLYLPLAGIALAVGAAFRAPGPALLVCLTMGLGGAVGTGLQTRIWHDEDSLWTASLARHPSPWIYGVIARELDLSGRPDDAVLWYRRATAPPHPMQEACYRVAAVSLARNAPEDILQDGQAALDAGCPDMPELRAPMVMALAMLGQWDQAEVRGLQVVEDPTGLVRVVLIAAGARRGELGPLRLALHEHPDQDPGGLYQRVAWLLERAGDAGPSQAVLVAGVASGALPAELLPPGATLPPPPAPAATSGSEEEDARKGEGDTGGG